MSNIIPFGQVGTTPSTKGGGRGWGFYQAGKIIYQSFSYMYIYIYIYVCVCVIEIIITKILILN